MSEIRIVISFYYHLLISGFLLYFSVMDVGHIDRIMLNTDVLSSFSLLPYNSYMFNFYLHLSSLVLEVHCYKSLTTRATDLVPSGTLYHSSSRDKCFIAPTPSAMDFLGSMSPWSSVRQFLGEVASAGVP